MTSQTAVALLGGRRGVGHKVATELDMDEAIRQGFSWAALDHFKRELGLTNQALAFLTASSAKTVERWFQRRERITPAASDRPYRVAKVAALAEEVLNDPEQARDWLRTPQHGLGNRAPFELLGTEAGASQVEGLLRRLQYGFFA